MSRPLFYTVAIAVLTVVLVSVHRYLYKRLVRDPGLAGGKRRLAIAVLIAGGLSIPLGMLVGRWIPPESARWLSLAAFSWLGALLYLVLPLLSLDLVVGVKRRIRPEAPADPARRQALARVGALATTAFAGSTVFIGARNALGDVAVEEHAVRLARLPKALDGVRIVQLSDLHIGSLLGRGFIDRVVETTCALKPDLVVITGDLVDGSTRLLGPDIARFGRLQSRFGTYFCTGNHEYYSGAAAWVRFLERMDIEVLTNRRVVIGDPAASFDLAGIPDTRAGAFIESHTPDLAGTLAGRDPTRELILLAHRPNPIQEAADAGVGLQLSGHTHGGQLWPITELTRLVHPYTRGLHLHDGKTWIYVSRGTGFWGPPLRLGAPAEITAITLESGLA